MCWGDGAGQPPAGGRASGASAHPLARLAKLRAFTAHQSSLAGAAPAPPSRRLQTRGRPANRLRARARARAGRGFGCEGGRFWGGRMGGNAAGAPPYTGRARQARLRLRRRPQRPRRAACIIPEAGRNPSGLRRPRSPRPTRPLTHLWVARHQHRHRLADALWRHRPGAAHDRHLRGRAGACSSAFAARHAGIMPFTYLKAPQLHCRLVLQSGAAPWRRWGSPGPRRRSRLAAAGPPPAPARCGRRPQPPGSGSCGPCCGREMGAWLGAGAGWGRAAGLRGGGGPLHTVRAAARPPFPKRMVAHRGCCSAAAALAIPETEPRPAHGVR